MDGRMNGATGYYERIFPAEIGRCEEARRYVMEGIAPLGFSALDLFQIELAVDEAFINAADHGSHCARNATVVVRVMPGVDRVTIIVKDFGGKPFNPTFFERLADKKTWGAGGRGIKIIKEIMDEVLYVFLEGLSTTLYMVKTKTPPSPPEEAADGADSPR